MEPVRDDDQANAKVDFCLALAKPLVIFNTRCADQALQLAVKHASRVDQARRSRIGIFAAISASLADHANVRPARNFVLQVEEDLRGTPNRELAADCVFAHACFDASKFHWKTVAELAQRSDREYQELRQPKYFDVNASKWLAVTAQWFLGDWKSMQILGREMLDETQLRHDRYGQFLATSGVASSLELISDQPHAMEMHRERNAKMLSDEHGMQFADFLHFVSTVHGHLYEARYLQAWMLCDWFQKSLRHSMIESVPVVSVTAPIACGVGWNSLGGEYWKRELVSASQVGY